MQTPRRSVSLALLASLLVLALGVWRETEADDKLQQKPTARQLLYPARRADVPRSLQPFVDKLLAPEQGPLKADGVKPTGVFARVGTRKYILDGNALKKGGTLGTRPFVFTTIPEALYGRSLLQVFSTIGYSADEVLTGQLGEEKVVILFQWEKDVILHLGRDGKLPEVWQRAVYPTTWDNLFSLVEKMAGDKDWHDIKEEGKPPVPSRLQLRSPAERHFLLGFPDAGKQRLKSSSYYALRDIKGADWEYRQILERSMSAAEHFSGDGTSKPTLMGQGEPPAGFPEFLGPNRELSALPEIAVIGLGKLRVAE